VAGDPAKIEGGTAVKCNVPVAEAIIDEVVLPERVQEALGQLVGAAKEGLLALSVEVGLGVLRELLEHEVDELVGCKHSRVSDPDDFFGDLGFKLSYTRYAEDELCRLVSRRHRRA
jgi:hypothetical protein